MEKEKGSSFKRLAFGSGNILIISNQHMGLHQDVYPLLEEAFSLFTPNEEIIQKVVVQFNRVIGTTTCVKTTPDDVIVYATRKNRKWTSRLVKNRDPEPSSEMTVVMKRCKGNIYRLLTAYIGGASEKEVADRNIRSPEELAASIAFWNCHALIYVEDDIQSDQ